MLGFTQYLSEGIKLKLIRGKGQDVLKMWDTKEKSWVELRGKSDFERRYDPKDPLHKAIAALGKSEGWVTRSILPARGPRDL